MENHSPSMKRVSMSVLASSLALLGGAVTATTQAFSDFQLPKSINMWHPFDRGSRRGGSTFVNRGLPGHFQNPPRPRKRCQRRGRR